MTGNIDRQALVTRHNPVLRTANPRSPLSVGNGEPAFTADISGFQSFTSAYQELPLCTMAQWGWHSKPLPDDLQDQAFRYEMMGFLPGHDAYKEMMRQTLKRVLNIWQWHDKNWGWDYPLTAMTAARVGEPELAVRALLMNAPTNSYLPNGHNYQEPRLPLYLPANGRLLTAVALMARGWSGGSQTPAPGFPRDWVVRQEGLRPML